MLLQIPKFIKISRFPDMAVRTMIAINRVLIPVWEAVVSLETVRTFSVYSALGNHVPII